MNGVAHLRAIARAPRAAGSAEEATARRYASGVLASAGYAVREEVFEYSRFPGRWGTPVAGLLGGVTLIAAAWLALAGHDVAASRWSLLIGVGALALFARAMLGDGVLDVPLLRTSGVNTIATLGDAEPTVWLVAHLDSKSQPVPSAVRVAAVVAIGGAVVCAAIAIALTPGAASTRTLWWVVGCLSTAGAVPLVMSTVGNHSAGAVDNASGVAAVLAAAEVVRPALCIGVLLPSAEELGLAGVRAWSRGRTPATALNCDGVDDDGRVVIMHSGRVPAGLVAAIQRVAAGDVVVRRMPPGLMTDSTALSGRGWNAVTISRGSLRTLARVHRPSDSLANLRGTGIDEVASLLARSAEALAT